MSIRLAQYVPLVGAMEEGEPSPGQVSAHGQPRSREDEPAPRRVTMFSEPLVQLTDQQPGEPRGQSGRDAGQNAAGDAERQTEAEPADRALGESGGPISAKERQRTNGPHDVCRSDEPGVAQPDRDHGNRDRDAGGDRGAHAPGLSGRGTVTSPWCANPSTVLLFQHTQRTRTHFVRLDDAWQKNRTHLLRQPRFGGLGWSGYSRDPVNHVGSRLEIIRL